MHRFRLVLLFVGIVVGVLVQPASGQSPEWVSFEEALAQAEQEGTKIMVDMYADWCPWCQRLQREVYTDEAVLAYLSEHFEVTRLNVEDHETTVRYEDETFAAAEMAVFLGAQGVPTIAFLSSDGDYLTHLPGFVEKEEFRTVLEYVNTEAFKEMTYMEFAERRVDPE